MQGDITVIKIEYIHRIIYYDVTAAAAYFLTKDAPDTLFGIKGSNTAKMSEVVLALTAS